MNEQVKDKYIEILELEITRNSPEEVQKKIADLKIDMLRNEIMDAQAKMDSAKLVNEYIDILYCSLRMAGKLEKVNRKRKPLLQSVAERIFKIKE